MRSQICARTTDSKRTRHFIKRETHGGPAARLVTGASSRPFLSQIPAHFAGLMLSGNRTLMNLVLPNL